MPERPTTSGRATDPFEREPRVPPPGGFLAALREFIYGMAGYEFARQAVEMRTALETVFMVTVVGDMVGLPVLPPYYSLRLLPYVTPEIATWRRRVLRDRELVDTHEFHLHGV
jgi:hypothetical protein